MQESWSPGTTKHIFRKTVSVRMSEWGRGVGFENRIANCSTATLKPKPFPNFSINPQQADQFSVSTLPLFIHYLRPSLFYFLHHYRCFHADFHVNFCFSPSVFPTFHEESLAQHSIKLVRMKDPRKEGPSPSLPDFLSWFFSTLQWRSFSGEKLFICSVFSFSLQHQVWPIYSLDQWTLIGEV